MDLQAMVDALGRATHDERSRYHLTLGGLIAQLRATTPDAEVVCDNGLIPGHLESYRGYYSDLAFVPSDTPTTVSNFLAACEKAVSATFEGYKGGEFLMTEDTPLWVSAYGDASGLAVIDATERDGKFILKIKAVE